MPPLLTFSVVPEPARFSCGNLNSTSRRIGYRRVERCSAASPTAHANWGCTVGIPGRLIEKLYRFILTPFIGEVQSILVIRLITCLERQPGRSERRRLFPINYRKLLPELR